MNLYLIIILSAITVEFLVTLVSRYLNLSHLGTELPSEFENYYDKDEYARSQSYTRRNSQFANISSTFNFLVIMTVILGGLFNALDIFVRDLGYSTIISGLIFFGLIFIIQDILSTPFNLYHTFIIEDEFGFNKTTPSTYAADKFKSYLIIITLGGPLISAILYLFESYENAWLFAWLLLVLLSIIMPKVFTQFIAPLFNKFTPLEDGDLKDLINDYAESVDFPLSEIYVVDGSRRSAHSNAYFTGFGKNKRIVLFDTLMENHTNEEIVAIIAHEVGHYKKKHILKGMVLSTIHSGVMLYVMQLFIKTPLLHQAFGMEAQIPSIYAGLVFFSLLYTPIEMLLSVLFNYISRKYEFQADEYSARTLNDTENLIEGLKNLSVKNLANLTPHPFPVFLNYSHPPVLERIKTLRNLHLS